MARTVSGYFFAYWTKTLLVEGAWKQKRPIVFGVAGGTASGKTTVARKILERVGVEHVAYLAHDAYYKDMSHLSFEDRAKQNFDHPRSLETKLLVQHVRQLMEWRPVHVPIYDFSQHRRTDETRMITPSPIIMVEGILIFTKRKLRDLMDIKIYVDTDADIRFMRRLRRDIEERDRTMEAVMAQYLETVRPMHLKFVEPSKRYADVIIPRGGMNEVALEMVVTQLRSLLPT